MAGRTECIYLNDETLRILSKESPVATRVKLLKDLCVKVSNSRLENVSIVLADRISRSPKIIEIKLHRTTLILNNYE